MKNSHPISTNEAHEESILPNPILVLGGPCSINYDNKDSLTQIIDSGANGVRIVGLKSRTKQSDSSDEMGIDYSTYVENRGLLINGGSTKDLKIYPSIEIANDLYNQYPDVIVATEIIDPLLQLPVWERYYKGNLFIWNPSVNQLGSNISIMSKYLVRNSNWSMGIKNGKWIGNTGLDTWIGLTTYLDKNVRERVYLIHRGFDIKRNMFNKKYRNVPNHKLAKRVKEETGLKLLFDPSHSLGSKLRSNIVRESINALKSDLYEGLLIEVGDSKTDKGQHISVEDLKRLFL